MRIDLGWPSPILSPNARAHWFKKSSATKAYRMACYYLAREAVKLATAESPVHMTVTFHPPDKRRRDRDNMIASMKAGMDGLADALGIDDSHFIPTYHMGDPVKGGRVTVQITSAVRIPMKGHVTWPEASTK
jgi:crossover junction endodeoxyribonuclease RusA